jgi:type IV pilus assembly protein PilF
LLVVLCLLSGCVTTTTGGFTPTLSVEEAVADYIKLAVGYYDAGDMARARRNINSALELDRNSSDVYNILALVMQREGDLALAEDNFRRAIRLDRNNSRARNNYAALLFSRGRYEESYEQLVEVTADTMYDGRAIAFENLGRSALALDRLDAARNAFERALQLNGNLYVSSLELAILRLDEGQHAAAQRSFTQYMTTTKFYGIPHSPRALFTGIRIGKLFQDTEMVNNFSLILETLYPDSPEYALFRELSDGA